MINSLHEIFFFDEGSIVLIDSNVVNLHCRISIFPGLTPLWLRIPESVHRVWICVRPWFTASSLWEISIDATYSNVEDQEIWLVERSALLGFVLPWVWHTLWEATFSPHVFVEWEVQDSVTIDGGFDSIFVPFKAVYVEVISKWLCVFVLLGCFLVGIMEVIWTPMKSGTERFTSTGITCAIVSSGLNKIDFAWCWPLTVCIVFWKEPDCWPDPVSLWHFSFDFSSSVFEVEWLNRSKSCRLNWVQVVSWSCSTSWASIESVSCALVSWRTSPNIHGTSFESIFSDCIL